MSLGALHNIIATKTPSTTAKNKGVTVGTRRTRNKNKVVHQIFAEWATHYCTNEPYWYAFFEAASRDVFPSHLYMSNNQLCCNLGRRKGVDIRMDNILEVTKFITDNSVAIEEEDDYLFHYKIYTWNEVKKKRAMCNQKIDQWVAEQARIYNFNELQTLKLHSSVLHALASGQLTEDTVQYVDNQIKTISNIIYDEQRDVFLVIPPPNYKPPNLTTNKKSASKLSFDSIYTSYCRYINERTINNS